MDASDAAPLAPAAAYRLPGLLHDIRLLDLLELSGTTVQASRLLRLSQPTISRRYRSLAHDFGLVRDRRSLAGCGYGTSATMRMLRLGCRLHRVSAGVARVGSDWLHQPLLASCSWLLPTPQRFRSPAHWLELVRQGVLDGALLSGLDLLQAEALNRQELTLLFLGHLPLAFAIWPQAPLPESATGVPELLVPDGTVAPGLRAALLERGLTFCDGDNNLPGAADWARRIEGLARALVVADWEADGWAGLRRTPFPCPLRSPLWVALPADWQEHAVLRSTVEALRRVVGDLAGEDS